MTTKKTPELTLEPTLEMTPETPVETPVATTEENALVPANGEMPDFLARFLGLKGDTNKSSEALYEADPDVEGRKMVYGAIPQPKSPSYHMKAQTGYWFIGREDSDPKAWPNPNMKEERRLMLIEHVGEVSRRGSYTNYHGARQMWSKNPDGSRGEGGIACQSANGKVPYPFFIGKDLLSPITGLRHRIGFGEDGKPLPADDICGQCPFSKFVKLDGGGFKPAPCKAANHWVFYDVDEDTTFVFRATNPSIQTAFEGNPNAAPKNGKPPFCVHDGSLEPFEGVGYWFTQKVSTIDRDYTNWLEVPEEEQPYLSAILLQGKKKPMAVNKGNRADALEIIRAGYAVSMTTSVPVTRSMPNGLLDESVVYPVIGFVSQTNPDANSGGYALVPDFRQAEAPLTAEELEAFKLARENYFASELPKFLRGEEHYAKVAERLAAANPQITAPEPPALPPWSQASDTVEGEIVQSDLLTDDDE
jgi:hypothetical protein